MRGQASFSCTGLESRRSEQPAPRRSAAGTGCTGSASCPGGPAASPTPRTRRGWTGSRAPLGCSTRAVCLDSSCVKFNCNHFVHIYQNLCRLEAADWHKIVPVSHIWWLYTMTNLKSTTSWQLLLLIDKKKFMTERTVMGTGYYADSKNVHFIKPKIRIKNDFKICVLQLHLRLRFSSKQSWRETNILH